MDLRLAAHKQALSEQQLGSNGSLLGFSRHSALTTKPSLHASGSMTPSVQGSVPLGISPAQSSAGEGPLSLAGPRRPVY